MTAEKKDILIRDRDAAEMLGCSRATFWRRVRDGTIPQPVHIGSTTRWPQTEIDEVIETAKSQRSGGTR